MEVLEDRATPSHLLVNIASQGLPHNLGQIAEVEPIAARVHQDHLARPVHHQAEPLSSILNYFSVLPFPVSFAPRWMANISNNTLLSDLSIPGTHDTATGLRTLIPFIQTQSWGLASQLLAGVRFIDMRLASAFNSLWVVHGPVFLPAPPGIFPTPRGNFLVDLAVCKAFLALNPTETIIMSVKKDNSWLAWTSTRSFQTIFNNCVRSNPGLFYTANTIPELGAVRGKIVLVSREPGIGGIPWKEPPFNIQDAYEVTNVQTKVEAVFNHLYRAAIDTSSSDWYINFASGTGLPSNPLITPQAVALATNGIVFHALEGEKGRFGTIIMDFPGEGVIQRIIDTNPMLNRVPGVPVSVTGVLRFGYHAQPTTIWLGFSGALDPASARDLSNYRLEILSRTRRTVTSRIASADYNPATDAVTLHPARRLPLKKTYQIEIVGTAPEGLRDVSGELIDGNGDGSPGGNFVWTFGRDALAGPNQLAPSVLKTKGSFRFLRRSVHSPTVSIRIDHSEAKALPGAMGHKTTRDRLGTPAGTG
jgi:1-phosphatidylinositol phosphodiesterase